MQGFCLPSDGCSGPAAHPEEPGVPPQVQIVCALGYVSWRKLLQGSGRCRGPEANWLEPSTTRDGWGWDVVPHVLDTLRGWCYYTLHTLRRNKEIILVYRNKNWLLFQLFVLKFCEMSITWDSQRLWGLNDWGSWDSQSSISESSSSSSSESSVESVAPRGLVGGSPMSAMEGSELDADSCSCVWLCQSSLLLSCFLNVHKVNNDPYSRQNLLRACCDVLQLKRIIYIISEDWFRH